MTLFFRITDCDKNAIFFSGHDVTLIPLLAVFDLIPETTIPFAADLTFELYRETSGNSISLIERVRIELLWEDVFWLFCID